MRGNIATSRRTPWLGCMVLLGAVGGCGSNIGESMGDPGSNMVGTGGGSVGTGGGNGAGTGGGGPGTGGGPTGMCSPLDAVPRRLWRLSAQQYGNSVRDLLGLAQAPVLNNSGGTSLYAFFSDDAAMVDDKMQFSIYEATQAVMTQIAPSIPALAGCRTGEAPQACAQRFAQTFGQKAFRRPLETDEVTALLAVYMQGSMQDFNTGIRLMIEALLQSPSFLHRTELGPSTLTADSTGKFPDTTLTPFEVATQLAFLFTDSSPDQALMDAAANGGLNTTEGVAAQVERLLGLDTVKSNITRIVAAWFNVTQLFSKTKDPALFAKLAVADQDAAQLQNDVYTSTQRFIDDVLWAGSGKVNDLLTSQRVFVNQRLAQLYGLTFSGPAGQFVAAEDTRRSGMLTQPGFLWALSDPTVTSIVKRGKFIHDDVMCQNPGPGPMGILDEPSVQQALAQLPTEIMKSNYRMGLPVTVASGATLQTMRCMGCHGQIDPYSRVLENFDPIGAYRTISDGVAVDPTATLGAPVSATITGPQAFAGALVDKDLLNACAVQKITSYTLGRMIRESATCEVQDLRTQFEQTGPTMVNLFRKVALANFVRARSGGVK